MPTKKKAKPRKAAAITSIKRNDPPMSIERAQQQIRTVAQYISGLLGPNATDDQVAMAFETCKALETNATTITKLAREQVLERLKARGVEDGTTRQLESNGWVLKAHRTHLGLDAKKVEARLREKGIDPSVYMMADISYKLNPNLEARLLLELGEAAADCHYSERWQVQAPEQLDTYTDDAGRLMTSSGSNALE